VATTQQHPGLRATRVVSALTGWLGSVPAILGSVFVVLLWAAYLPFVKIAFLNTNYQLLINTTTTIVTFIMVFISQSTQNRDGRALQTKLDAILVAVAGDHEQLMGLEDLPEKAIKAADQRRSNSCQRSNAANTVHKAISPDAAWANVSSSSTSPSVQRRATTSATAKAPQDLTAGNRDPAPAHR
jgi:low affinity Fe/Cu permease